MRAFEPGIGRIEPYDPNNWQGGTFTDYYHTDHLGTLRVMTGPNGMPLDLNGSSSGHDMVFTAFGEIVVGVSDGGSDRYGYVGAHGYQAHDEMPFLHLGARYYDPAIGRLLQRDPIGILGALNTFAYPWNPVLLIDPDGLTFISDVQVGAARAFLWLTGGRDSWLDDPRKVRKAQDGLVMVAQTSLFAASLCVTGGFNPTILARPPVPPPPTLIIRPPRWLPPPPSGSNGLPLWYPPISLN